MEIEQFNNLDFKDKLTELSILGNEIDNIFPWYGNLRIVRIYSLYEFLVEVECDLTTKKITSINSFNDFKYLEKYPHYLKEKMFKILNHLNLIDN